MRSFLPIKGPGGRYLTPNEKVALLVLGFTLVLCVLTLTAGDGAYADGPSRNPVFGMVAWLSRSLGGGIVALYGLVLVWSGLIFFKGERVARIGPLPGRLFAALGVTIGVSGVLGLGNLQSAGNLGAAVGSALGNTLGDAVSFPLLLMLMMLGFHLAGQGAWSALRVPAVAVAGAGGLKAGAYGFEAGDRFGTQTPMPDDGDPTADERSLAVTKAMEEIERSQGVTIVDVESETEDESGTDEERASIGEEVEAAGAPAPDTEEDEVRRGLDDVHRALGGHAVQVAEDAEVDEEDEVATSREDEPADREEEHDAYATAVYAPQQAEEYEDDDEDAYVRASEAPEEEGDEADDGEVHIYEEVSEDEDDDEVYADDAETETSEAVDDDDTPRDHGLVPVPPAVEAAPDPEEEFAAPEEAAEPEETVEPAETEETDHAVRLAGPRPPSRYLWDEAEETRHVPEAAETVEAGVDPAGESEPQADGFVGDPYAQGGLVRRLGERPVTSEESLEDERPYTSFDWRGHPLD